MSAVQAQEGGSGIYQIRCSTKGTIYPSPNRAGGWLCPCSMWTLSPEASTQHGEETGLALWCHFLSWPRIMQGGRLRSDGFHNEWSQTGWLRTTETSSLPERDSRECPACHLFPLLEALTFLGSWPHHSAPPPPIAASGHVASSDSDVRHWI